MGSAGLAKARAGLQECADVTDALSFLRIQARTQRFTLGIPREFRVSPDHSRVLFLRSESGVDRRNSLWELDLASGEETKVVDAADVADGEGGTDPAPPRIVPAFPRRS